MPNYYYNGVELPALPEWDKTTYPYAYIFPYSGSYRLRVFSERMYYDEYATASGSATAAAFKNTATVIAYKITDGEWVLASSSPASVKAYDVSDPSGTRYSAMYYIWANTDILWYEDDTVHLPASDPVPVGGVEWKKHDSYKPNTEWSRKTFYSVMGGKWVEQDAVVPLVEAEPSTYSYIHQKYNIGYIVFQAPVYANGTFVSVRYSNEGDSQDGYYSDDGFNWTEVLMPAASDWYGVCYGNGRWIAWSQGSQSSTTIAYSDDNGRSWSLGTTLGNWSNGEGKRIPKGGLIYAEGRFICYTAYGVIYSTDGITWQSVEFADRMNSTQYLLYGDGKYVAIGPYGRAANSTDGINWANVTLPASISVAGFVYGNGVFVATPLMSTTCLYSTDGVNWTTSTIPNNSIGEAGGRKWHAVFDGNKFVTISAISDYNLIAHHSEDGRTWGEAIVIDEDVAFNESLVDGAVFADGKIYLFASFGVVILAEA